MSNQSELRSTHTRTRALDEGLLQKQRQKLESFGSRDHTRSREVYSAADARGARRRPRRAFPRCVRRVLVPSRRASRTVPRPRRARASHRRLVAPPTSAPSGPLDGEAFVARGGRLRRGSRGGRRGGRPERLRRRRGRQVEPRRGDARGFPFAVPDAGDREESRAPRRGCGGGRGRRAPDAPPRRLQTFSRLETGADSARAQQQDRGSGSVPGGRAETRRGVRRRPLRGGGEARGRRDGGRFAKVRVDRRANGAVFHAAVRGHPRRPGAPAARAQAGPKHGRAVGRRQDAPGGHGARPRVRKQRAAKALPRRAGRFPRRLFWRPARFGRRGRFSVGKA